MSLLPYDPFRYFQQVQKQFEKMFESGLCQLPDSKLDFTVQLEEREHELIAICHIPDLKRKEDVKVEIVEQRLKITRKMEGSYEVKGDKMYKSDKFYGQFQRFLPLPCPVSSWDVKYEKDAVIIHMRKYRR